MFAAFSSSTSAGVATGVGLNEVLASTLKKQLSGRVAWENLPSGNRLQDQVNQGILRANTILLGTGITKPINLAQKVHSFDKTIPVLILAEPDRCEELRRAIMFAPLLGNVVAPWSIEDIDSVGDEVGAAVERHRQRRFYLDSIDSVQPIIGKLSLSQPELGHYLGRLLDQAPIGVVSLDAAGQILSINRRAGIILGVKEGDSQGSSLSHFFGKQDRPRLANLMMRSAVGQHFGMKPEILQSVRPGAQARFLEATASTIVHHAGRRGYMVILQDVTAREQADSQRRKAEEYMQTLSGALEQTADSVMITDAERVIRYVNPAFESLTGYSKSEVTGSKTYFLRSGVQDEEFYRSLLETISRGDVFRGVFVNRRKDGSLYHEQKTITPIKNSEGNITNYISTGQDITERLKNEEEIRIRQEESAHAARLSTLGEMTSGIAHELNQPLCAITTYAQTCMRIIDRNDGELSKLSYGLEQVVKQAELAGGIFQRLRNFARKRVDPKRKTALLAIVDETVSLVSPELNRTGISLKIEHPGSDLFIAADKVQIEQVLINLIRNGIDAINDIQTDERIMRLAVKRMRNEVKLSLTDTGGGCSEAAVDRLFEPFFSTKSTGLGIGLGISESIIEAHGGRLYLESNSDRGATFSFLLPLWQSKKSKAATPG